MSKFQYEDLLFNVEKFVPWNEIAEVIGSENHIDEYIMTMKTVAKWCEDKVEPMAEDNDRNECRLEFDSEGHSRVIIPKGIEEGHHILKDLGLFCGATIYEENGGFDFPLTSFFAIGEIISMADSSLGLTPMLNEGCAQVLVEFGNDEIRSEYLPLLISGDRICAMGLTEPNAGSDLVNGIQTTARPVIPDKDNSDRINELQKLGDVYIINGTKIFITNGYGDVLTLARTTEGISMFLVFAEDKVVPRMEHKLGIRGSATCEVLFEDSPGVLIGNLGGGLIPNMLKLMNIARIGVATQGLAIGQRAHNFAIEYANDRVQFGVPIIEHSPVRQIIFENEVDLQASRALVYAGSFYYDMKLAISRKMQNMDPNTSDYNGLKNKLRKYSRIADIMISLSKYDSSELGNKVVSSSLQVFGGNGFTREYPMERFYRDVRITNIYEGTSQIQIEQVFNETFYVEKLGLINQFKLGEGRTFVETEKNRVFFDSFMNEYKEEILNKVNKNQNLLDLIEKVETMKDCLREARQTLFLEERTRGKEEGRKYNAIYQQDYVDIVAGILKSYLLLKQSIISDHKADIAKAYIDRMVVKADYLKNKIKSCIDDLIDETYYRVISH